LAISFRTPRPALLLASLALCASTAFAGNVHRAIVTRVAPAYPELAKRMHIGGKVMLLVTIQADGSVSATKVESGHALLTAAAEDAVKRWHFSPNPETTESEIEVNFTLESQ
jgi:TonB family protein